MAAESGIAKEEEVIDALEFAPEKDILATFGGEWQDKTAAIKEWKLKVEAMQELITASTNVKIIPGNFESLTKFLKKEVNNANINISMIAIKCGTTLCEGLKDKYNTNAKDLINTIL